MLAPLRRGGVPDPAALLGLAGLLPFVVGALATLDGGPLGRWAPSALLGYSAVILSFMGGVHWGLAMAAERPSWLRYGASVVPALLGWAALLIGGGLAFLLLVASFASLLAYDLGAVRAGEAPAWYPRLRWPSTLVVTLCLLLAALSG